MIQDKNISRRRHADFFHAELFGFTGSAAEGDVGQMRTIQFTATSDTVAIGMPLPRHWDFDEDIFIRYYLSDAAGGAVVLTPEFELSAHDAAEPTINDGLVQMSDGTTATISITLSAGGIDPTVWMKLAAGTIDEEAAASDFIWFELTLTTDAGNIDPHFHGMEVNYLPKYTTGDLMKVDDDPADA